MVFALCLLFGGISLHAGTYDLDAYLARVEKHSKDIKLAHKELEMAKVYKKEALATALPIIQLQADYKRNLKDNFLYIDFPDGDTGELTNQKFKINYKNDYALQMVVKQPLFSFKVGSALKAAKEYKQLTNKAYDATRITIRKMAKKGFYQALLLKKVWEVNEASAQNAKENFQQMQKKFHQGQISKFKLLQAESRWQSYIPDVTQAERNYNLAVNNLKNMAGIPMSELLDLQGDFRKLPPFPQVEESLESVLGKRPDFNALLWEEKLRGTNVKSQKAELMPTLDLNLIYNFSSMSDKFKFERKNTSYIAGLTLSVPIFTGGYQRAQITRAKIELDKTRIKIDKEKENIYNELSNIRLRMEEARERIASAAKNIETAQKAFEIAEVTAANGLATQLELKDARILFDQATLSRYAAAYDYLDAYFDWVQAVGSIDKK